jgi:hypothetical protein
MTDTTNTSDRPRLKRGNGSERLGPVLVSGIRFAAHFGVVRQHIDQLAAQGVIERNAQGLFDQDVSRLKYLAHLRAEHCRSPRTAAGAERTRAKTLQPRLARERGELVRQADVDDLIHKVVEITITGLSGLEARCAPRGDLVTRQNIRRATFELRRELAAIGERMADETRRAGAQ